MTHKKVFSAPLFVLTFSIIAAKPVWSDEKKDFEALKTQSRTVQMSVSNLLTKTRLILSSNAKANARGNTILLKGTDVSNAIQSIKQVMQRAQALNGILKKNPAKNQDLIAEYKKTVEGIFKLGSSTNIITEFQESLSLLVAALEGENSPRTQLL
jgi:hypothetical protein